MPRASMRNDFSEAVGSSSAFATTHAIGRRSVTVDAQAIRQRAVHHHVFDLRHLLDRGARLAEIDEENFGPSLELAGLQDLLAGQRAIGRELHLGMT